MLTYCLKCRKNTKNIDAKMIKTKNGKLATCSYKKSRFVKEQEASGILSSVGIRTPLSKIPVLGAIFF